LDDSLGDFTSVAWGLLEDGALENIFPVFLLLHANNKQKYKKIKKIFNIFYLQTTCDDCQIPAAKQRSLP
jgi:hypothetical protein